LAGKAATTTAAAAADVVARTPDRVPAAADRQARNPPSTS